MNSKCRESLGDYYLEKLYNIRHTKMNRMLLTRVACNFIYKIDAIQSP